MAKNTLIGIYGTARKVRKIYIGVNGTARQAKKGYIGINGVARLFYSGDPVLIFEQSAAGTYSLALAPGKYEITLIGGGGGASGRRSTAVNNHHYAQGGVGGTLQFTANLTSSATVQIVVGAGGTTNTGTFSSASGGTVSGTAGGATSITGFPNLTASAGGGTAASTRATSTSACTRTVGTIGKNTLSGSAVIATSIDNPNACVSSQSTSTSTQRTPTGRVNDNWPEDNTRGKSGDSGWNGNNFISMVGATGFVRIKML